ncbi:MAG: hypothetical protein A2014_10375 [Spirochaetes bacterium GWF1_49_6]|nr:MAG: hypothetical protein A2014_10375 [Spirochaetes bacterium GWF1_49_6]
MDKPRCALKLIYSCFDCFYFQNRSAHIDIQKEKYHCMVEKKDFSFDKMFPNGVPAFCPLPEFESIRPAKEFEPFQTIQKRLEQVVAKK